MSTSDYGIKVSKPGVDVKTADDDELVMSSSFNMLKTKATGTVTAPTTVAHGLAYVPIVFGMREISSSPKEYSILGGNSNLLLGVDGTDLTFGGTDKWRYYIFYQEAN